MTTSQRIIVKHLVVGLHQRLADIAPSLEDL